MGEFLNSSKKTVTDFLQSVIIIDDEAFLKNCFTEDERIDVNEDDTGATTELVNPGRPESSSNEASLVTDTQNVSNNVDGQAILEEESSNHESTQENITANTEPQSTSDDNIEPNDIEHTLNAKILTDTFASEGLLCSVIRPSETDNIVSQAEKVLKKADIIVLDWHLKDSDEESEAIVKELIKVVIKDDTGPVKAMRYIAIYTGEEDLKDKLNSVVAYIDDIGISPNQKEDYKALYDYLQVSIYAKKIEKRLDTREIQRDEKELVAQIIDDFTNLVNGLVPNMALQSLAEIRRNTHKILSNFTSSLDSAYLAHRAMLPEPQDSESLMIDILISEIQSILEDSNSISQTLGNESIMEWSKEKLDRNQLKELFFDSEQISKDNMQKLLRADYDIPAQTNLKDEDTRALVIETLFDGSIETFYEQFCSIFEKNICTNDKESLKHIKAEPTKISKYLSQDAANHDKHDTKFAILSTVKTCYSNPTPSMTLGTIVIDESDNFYICIIPRCDAARIHKDNWTFPFLPMEEDENKFDIVVEYNESFNKLKIIYDTYMLNNINLKKTEELDNNNIPLKAKHDEHGKYFFESSEDKKYYWVADVKVEKAQDISNKFTTNLSRVGFNESEYLRRSYQKKSCS